MKKKRIAISAVILLLLAGCGGGKYAEEKTMLTTVTATMETFTAAMASAGTPEDVASIIMSFTGKIENVLPKMKELTQAHPDWENNPPAELKTEFEKFKKATAKFQEEAVPKVMQFARNHADNPTLQSAIEKFGSLMSQL